MTTGLVAPGVTPLPSVVIFAEGVICLIMAAPIMRPGAIFGAWLVRATIRWWRNRRGVMMVIALPLLVMPVEARIDWPGSTGPNIRAMSRLRASSTCRPKPSGPRRSRSATSTPPGCVSRPATT